MICLKKKFLIGALSFGLIFGSSTADAAKYFMQGDAKGSSTPYGDNVKVGKCAQTADAKIYYEVYGKGAPVLILHGGGVGTPYEMGKIIDDLKKNFQIIVMSTRGHGRSEIGHSPMTYEQKADDAVAVIKEVTNKPVQIIGFSDGAYTAYKIAAMYPTKVERIVAIGAGTLKAGFFSGEMSLDALAQVDSQFVAEQKKIRPESERWQEFCNDYMKFWSGMSVGEEIFGAIKCPVLLVVGDEDDHAPVITVLEAHQMLKNSRLCVVPKAWHDAFNGNYEVFKAAVMPFVNAPIKNLKDGSRKVDYNSKN